MAGIVEAANVAALNNIDDKCLLQICHYLNLYDTSSLAATCLRLREFVNTFIFPKIAKNLDLKTIVQNQTVLHWDSCAATVDGLISQLRQFGNFVEHISLTGGRLQNENSVWKKFGPILRLCPNLKTLRVADFLEWDNFSKVLNNVSPHIKELHWINSCGMKTDCSIVINKLNGLEKITVTGLNAYTGKLFKHCNKLTYLDVERFGGILVSCEEMSLGELCRIFERNYHTLRTLKLRNYRYLENDYIYQMIDKTLPNLESLEITDRLLEAGHNYRFIENKLRLINILNLNCSNRKTNINWIIQTLSVLGVIEELTISGGQFLYDESNIVPMTFKKLRKLCWHSPKASAALFLGNITQANMPELQDFMICKGSKETDDNFFNEIVKLVESKKSLSSICVTGNYDPSLLVIKIIEMLKADLSGDHRAFLSLGIPRRIGDEQVITISSS